MFTLGLFTGIGLTVLLLAVIKLIMSIVANIDLSATIDPAWLFVGTFFAIFFGVIALSATADHCVLRAGNYCWPN